MRKLFTAISVLSAFGAASVTAADNDPVNIGNLYFSVLSDTEKTALFEGGIFDDYGMDLVIPAFVVFSQNGNAGYTVTAIADEACTERIPGSMNDIYKTDYQDYDAGRACTLNSVIIPPTILTVGREAFAGARSMEEIMFPLSVVDIGASCCYWSAGLKKILLPAEIKTIPEEFAGMCRYLSECDIPQSVETIGEKAFFRCNSLAEVKIPAYVREIGEDAFTALVSLEDFYVDPANECYSTSDGILLDKEKTVLVAWPFARKEVVVPEGVREIFGEALNWGFDLTSLDLPASLKTLEKTSFCHDVNLGDITVRSVEPPLCGGDIPVFAENVFENATLHVPQSAVEAYRAAPVWSGFRNIKGIDDVGVDRTMTDNADDEFYTIDGIKVSEPQKGQMLIRRCNEKSSIEIF